LRGHRFPDDAGLGDAGKASTSLRGPSTPSSADGLPLPGWLEVRPCGAPSACVHPCRSILTDPGDGAWEREVALNTRAMGGPGTVKSRATESLTGPPRAFVAGGSGLTRAATGLRRSRKSGGSWRSSDPGGAERVWLHGMHRSTHRTSGHPDATSAWRRPEPILPTIDSRPRSMGLVCPHQYLIRDMQAFQANF
jgi:hypothetical protein